MSGGLKQVRERLLAGAGGVAGGDLGKDLVFGDLPGGVGLAFSRDTADLVWVGAEHGQYSFHGGDGDATIAAVIGGGVDRPVPGQRDPSKGFRVLVQTGLGGDVHPDRTPVIAEPRTTRTRSN
ncbi:hypothetical protein [Streptomyces sp. NBC_00454]|uniref:hypothetical protein n=1 Tax=Streptomyces sp. NBC_00454 TaxID=2975747 RepID=UPI0032441E1A